MRIVALAAAFVGLAGCGGDAAPGAAAAPTLPDCRPGDLARTTAGPTAFTNGWVRLKLVRCPAAARPGVAARVEIEGATADLAFARGRPRASTLGVLAAGLGGRRGSAAFALEDAPQPSAAWIVLAPWTGAGPPPRIGAVRLAAPPPQGPGAD